MPDATLRLRLYFTDRAVEFTGDFVECALQIMNAKLHPSFQTYRIEEVGQPQVEVER